MSLLLIAEREFRTYVATLSFWLSLAVAPLAAGTAVLFSGHAQSLPVSIQGGSTQLVQSASLALAEAGRLEGKSFVIGQRGGARLSLTQRTPRILEARFSDGFPLSATGRAMVGHVIERDMARAGTPAPIFDVHQSTVQADRDADPARLAGLVTMAMLWLTLTGSLGMLLQAIARERANRALESLLASVPSWEIVAGKLLGVGAVSTLILLAWLGSAAAFAAFLPPQTGLVGSALLNLAQPLTLLRDALIYLCAFGFYGSATLVVGAIARDSASAQNLARPLFLVLLVAFFVALAVPTGDASWLLFIPPLTPFVLLVNSVKSVALMSQAILMGMLLAASAGLLLLAARLLSVSPGIYHIFRGRPADTQPLV
jgi:ABC-type Na+ efflux pump permease subunit